MSEHESGINVALNAGKEIGALGGKCLFDVSGTPVAIIPAGMTLNPMNNFRHRPLHIDKTVTVSSHMDFIDYWNRFADKDSTIFYDIEKHQFVGVIDYHESEISVSPDEPDYAAISANRPRHGLHKVVYNCPKTVEAKRWLENSGKRMSQMDFAQFIEDGTPEIVNPPASEMMEIATTLSAVNKVNFSSGVRLDNGAVSLKYQEEIQGSAGATGQFSIPSKIAIAVLLFRGDVEGYRLEANFRYRIESGKLVLWYDLIRSHVALEDAVKAIANTIREGIKTGHMIAAVLP